MTSQYVDPNLEQLWTFPNHLGLQYPNDGSSNQPPTNGTRSDERQNGHQHDNAAPSSSYPQYPNPNTQYGFDPGNFPNAMTTAPLSNGWNAAGQDGTFRHGQLPYSMSGDQSQQVWNPASYPYFFQPFPAPPQPDYSNIDLTKQSNLDTISPFQLAYASPPQPDQNWNDFVMMQSRASTSSASSDGPAAAAQNYDDLARMMQRAHLPDSGNGYSQEMKFTPSQSQSPNPSLPSTEYTDHFVNGTKPARHIPYKTLSEALPAYINAPNRLAFGECKIIISTPKVAQKSYGTEKRYICPHPQATMVGAEWWTGSPGDSCPTRALHPPRVEISLTGEQPPKDTSTQWSSLDQKSLDNRTTPVTANDQPFLGYAFGKNLHISEGQGTKRETAALVTVKAPLRYHAGEHGWGPQKGSTSDISNDIVLGKFDSRDIRIISKPSKKKSNTKSTELVIQHGSTIALFNRTKAQSASTRFLCVDQDMTRFTGSDARPVPGARGPNPIFRQTQVKGFRSSAGVWESFIIYHADPSRPSAISDRRSNHLEWPNVPINAIDTSHTLAPSIRYNTFVILQSLQTGLVSPVLIIRRIGDETEVSGQDGTVDDRSIPAPEGERPGDLVSQLQKVAFELWMPQNAIRQASDARWGGAWLSCDGDYVSEKFISEEKKWSAMSTSSRPGSRPNSVPSTPIQRPTALSMTPHTNTIGLPSTPSSPTSAGSSEYFGPHSRKTSSTTISSLKSPTFNDNNLPSTDGGPIRRQRKGSGGPAPLTRPMHKKRASADSSANSSYEHIQSAAVDGLAMQMYWTMKLAESCVWSIVSTEQVSYTFYVPPYATSTEPIVPFPAITKMLSVGGEMAPPQYNHQYTSMTTMPLWTFYGKNFVKAPNGGPKYEVYYGDKPASFNEYRCADVMAASEPPRDATPGAPILLVRQDGQSVIPTSLHLPL